jgi:hypothetical protein
MPAHQASSQYMKLAKVGSASRRRTAGKGGIKQIGLISAI